MGKATRAHRRSFLRRVAWAAQRVLFAVALCLVATSLASRAHASPNVFLKGPYLQELGATGVTVRVELDSLDTASLELTREGQPPVVVASKEPRTFHSIRAENLQPKTRYAYVVKTGAGASAKGELVTAAASDATPAPFTFLVYGDNRSDDAGHATVVRAMMQSPSDFLVNTGDFVPSGGNALDWQTFFDIERPLLRDRCMFSCVGNHELSGDQAAVNYARYLGPSAPAGRVYLSFRWGNARFFMLNAFHDWTAGEERAWLDKELASADSEAGLAWRIAVVHHGPWSSGPHGASPTLGAARVPQLLAQHKIDLVFSGHDHIYERGDANGMRYIVSGGGGAPVYRDIRVQPTTRKVEAVHHFVEVTVASDAVKLTTKRADGSILERCGFAKSPGWDCDGNAKAAAAAASTAAPSPAGNASSAGGGLASSAPPSESSSRCGCRLIGAAARSESASESGSAAFVLCAAAASLFLARARTKKR